MIGAGAGAQAHGWGDLAQNKDLPEEYRRQLTAFVYEPGWTEEQMSAALPYSERDMAKAVIAQNTESPAEGWRSLYNDFTAARDEILQPAMDALSKGMKQGVDILPLGEDGRGIRVSNNAPWYQEYYKEHGKAPNQAQLRDLAYLLTVGDASAPQVEGWIPTTREAAEAMDAAHGELDELNGHIQTLENIKERMMKVDSFEVKGSAGLSPEGYKLYRQIIEMLEKIGGEQKEDKQTKVARMNAMLFAHHADIFAAAMRTQEGKEKYTALDYFKDRFALRYGGKDMRQNGLYQSATDVPSAEKEAVRKQYEGTEQWMKAPNGKPTNLTEDQWVAVRTPAFKAWFGDWENDPKNASKVVDENGEPLVVYHGTPLGGFDTFKRQQNYFTSMKWYADRYQDESASSNYIPDKHENPATKMTYAVFLNIKKPFDTRNKKERGIFEKEFYRQWGYGAPLSDKGLPDWTDGDDLQEFFEEKGYEYDGLILDEGGIPDNNGGVISRGISYVSFEPNQVKSATDNNGAFSVDDANIYRQMPGVSAEERLARDEAAWKRQLDGFMETAEQHSMRSYRIMETPLVFSLLNPQGFRVQMGTDIAISHAVLWKVLRKEEVKGKSHGHALDMAPEIMKELPRALADPIMILRNRRGSHPNAPILSDEIVAVVDLKDKNGSTAIVPIVLKERNGKYMLKTFFGKDDATWFQKRMMLGDVLYAHKKRALTWVKAIQRHELPGRFTLQDSFFSSIPTEDDLVKAREENQRFYQYAWVGSKADNARMAAEMDAVRTQYEGTAAWMKAPNGAPTQLTEEQWLAVRTPMFKEVFGDWERLAVVHEIQNLTPLDVHLTGKPLEKKEAEEEEVFSSFGEVEHSRYGTYAAFPKGTVGKILKHKGMDVSQMLADLPRLFSSSVLAFTEAEYKKEGHKEHPNIFAYHHYVNQFTVGAKTYYIRFSLREEKTTPPPNKRNAKRILHSTGISDIHIYEDNRKDVSSQRIRVMNPGEGSQTSFIDYRLAEFFDSVKDMSAASLDENGEPLPSSFAPHHAQAGAHESYGEIARDPSGRRIITLFAGANESTFLHEMGHMFLMDLDALAQLDEASAKDLETVNAWAEWHEGAAEEYEDTPWAEEFRAHEEAIRKAVAAGDVIAEKAARERWRQERFARGFELFLTEGKAPSHALRGVFRKFKEYLRKIYHFVRSVGGHPSPEVQAVMALMIATEDEIKAASLDALYRPMEGLGGKEGIKTLLGETEAETYGRWLKEAQEEAEDILRARVMKDLKKEARAEVRERLDAERERKRAELENDPVHLAAAAIQAAGSEDVALNWFPSLEAYKKAHAERKPLETELAEHMEDYAKKIDTEIMTSHLTEESIVRAMQTPKAYHRRIAIEMAALRRRERMMQKVGGKEQDVHADAVAVRGDEFGAYKHIKELRDRAIAYYRNVLQGTSVENVHLGKVDIDENGLVEFTGSGRREAKSTSAKPEKLLLIKYLPKLIRGATNITENAAQKESHAGEYFYYLHTNASVDGTTVPVVITLIKRNDGSIQYYNHTLPSLEESIKKNRRYLRDQYLPMKPSAPRPSAILLSPLYHRGTW